MTTPISCRLLIDPPADGPWNMAVDEMLLTTAAETGTATLRFYQWNQPTLSLGYFQHYADRQSYPIDHEVDTVRRLSGGGAILHDHEWTYSLAIPSAHPLASETETLYQAVHGVLLRWLQRAATSTNLLSQNSVGGCQSRTGRGGRPEKSEQLGDFGTCSKAATTQEKWRLQLCQPEAASSDKPQPFLCFHRRSSGDIVLHSGNPSTKGHKMLGSAQRRRRGAVLQHGSLLLAASDEAPELQGFSDLTSVELSHSLFVDDLTQELAQALSLDFELSCLTTDQQNSVHSLVKNKYSAAAWTQRR